jgi:hypothetical protein
MEEQQNKSIIRYLRPAFVFLFACGLWAVRMPLVEAYYERTLRLGYYRPDADSIGIPIAGEAVSTFMLFPVLAVCLFLVLRRFPARCSWLAWSKRQWGWSAFWTLLFGLFIYQTTDYLVENLQIGLQRNALVNIGWILVWLELRAVIVSKLSA